MAIIKFWQKGEEYNLIKDSKKYINISIENKKFVIKDIKLQDNNIFVNINNQYYGAKILKHTDQIIEIYILNFNKVFSFDLKPSVKNKAINLIRKDGFSIATDLGSADLGSADLGSADLGSADLGSADLGEFFLLAPLSGRVIKVFVLAGQFVNKGQVLLTIESMKMENEIRATKNCFIKSIQIKDQDLVKQSQVLMYFAKKGEDHE